ncbi:MAG: hypothetical protein IKF83_03195 [Clostridia bacterium]|nr:hypothetical protein [Clostridia bacterium]
MLKNKHLLGRIKSTVVVTVIEFFAFILTAVVITAIVIFSFMLTAIVVTCPMISIIIFEKFGIIEGIFYIFMSVVSFVGVINLIKEAVW